MGHPCTGPNLDLGVVAVVVVVVVVVVEQMGRQRPFT
jgi:hypothetical protein